MTKRTLDYSAARVTIELTMTGEIIEIAPELDPRSRQSAEAYAFAEQYSRALAEQSIQGLQLRHSRHGLPTWLAIAVASGSVVAFAFVYTLSR